MRKMGLAHLSFLNKIRKETLDSSLHFLDSDSEYLPVAQDPPYRFSLAVTLMKDPYSLSPCFPV